MLARQCYTILASSCNARLLCLDACMKWDENVHIVTTHYQDNIIQRLSKLTRLIQVMEYCKSFMNTCPQTKDSRYTTTLSTQEIENALTCCMKMVRISYAQETRFENASRGSNLEYAELEEGCNSLLSYQFTHQMISPAQHNFTRLVVLAEHIRLHHAGPQHLTSYILQRYWSQFCIKCLTCYWRKMQASQQLKGELPSFLIHPSRPFSWLG
jgi:hypothetical protein